MALSILSVPIPPGICHFFFFGKLQIPHGRDTEKIHTKQKHREKLIKVCTNYALL